jgi:hypothetical protein
VPVLDWSVRSRLDVAMGNVLSRVWSQGMFTASYFRSGFLKFLPPTIEELYVASSEIRMPLSATSVKFPASLVHLRLYCPTLSENHLGELPANLISLNLDFEDVGEDSGNYGFDTFDISNLPDSLLELTVTMPDPDPWRNYSGMLFLDGRGQKREGVKLVGKYPKGLRKITLSEGMSIEISLPAGVERFTA